MPRGSEAFQQPSPHLNTTERACLEGIVSTRIPHRRLKRMVKKSAPPSELIVDNRQSQRRKLSDRRSGEGDTSYQGSERRKTHRRKVARRRQIDPTTCERDYNDEEIDFMKAMDTYKRQSGRQFPTWSEVLEVLRSLGYRKVEQPTKIIIKKHEIRD